MAGAPIHRKPSFLWQGVLILLPVALMAGFGLWALLRERNAVEQEARERAKEILEALPADFGSRVAARMTEFSAAYGWLQNQEKVLSAWPGSQEQQWWATNLLLTELPAWQAALPDVQPPSVFSLQLLLLDTNGELRFSSFNDPPLPPEWFLKLTADQREAWTALRVADNSAKPVSNVVQLARQFLGTNPSESARANAEFIQLRAESQTEPATNAVTDLLLFFSRHYSIQSVTAEPLSETGVPLSTLALAEALRRAQECGVTESLWTTLQAEIVLRPSILTPSLLGEAGPLAARDSRLAPPLEALRLLWNIHQTQHEFAREVKRAGYISGLATTNFWLAAMGQHWLCAVHPDFVQTSISNQAALVPGSASLRLESWPEPVVARGFAEALRDVKTTLPGYFALSVDCCGRQVALRPPWRRNRSEQLPGEVLAQARFSMSRTGGLHQPKLPKGHDRNVIWFETMPSHPQFTLQIHLADRHLLYAAQRQRQVIFGGLIALSAMSALIGFTAAQRSFRRQQQLNEMKSNFVSSVSHELRAPIASVRLMAENLAGEKLSEPRKLKEYFGFIVQECQRLSSLIENVLDFSRIEQGRKQYEFEPTDVCALVNQTVRVMQPYAAEKGVTLKLETSNIQHPTSNIEFDIDGKAIQQALVNLIDNAIKHSPNGETVKVGIEVRGPGTKVQSGYADRVEIEGRGRARETLNLSVSDQGPGIPLEEHEKTPVDRAKIELLLDHHAEPNVRDNNGKTPLDCIKDRLAQSGLGDGTKASLAEIAALLRRHGALDNLPYWDRITVSRPSAGFSRTVFQEGTNDWNRFTLLETILNYYQSSQYTPVSFPAYPGASYPADNKISFPDLTRVVIVRPARDTTNETRIKINLLGRANAIDCSRDVPLEFGDVVEIPEHEHTLAETDTNTPAALKVILDYLRSRAGSVRLTTGGGQTIQVSLDDFEPDHCYVTSVLQSPQAQNVLTTESDFSRVKVTRGDPATGRKREWNLQVNNGRATPNQTGHLPYMSLIPPRGMNTSQLAPEPNLWLRDGDVIEVPEK